MESASFGGMPPERADVTEAYAEYFEMLWDRSLNAISSLNASCERISPAASASRIRSWRYRIDTSGKRNAALIMLANTAGSDLHSADAWRGLVDQTKEETVGERGRKAMGPVGRNL